MCLQINWPFLKSLWYFQFYISRLLGSATFIRCILWLSFHILDFVLNYKKYYFFYSCIEFEITFFVWLMVFRRKFRSEIQKARPHCTRRQFAEVLGWSGSCWWWGQTRTRKTTLSGVPFTRSVNLNLDLFMKFWLSKNKST